VSEESAVLVPESPELVACFNLLERLHKDKANPRTRSKGMFFIVSVSDAEAERADRFYRKSELQVKLVQNLFTDGPLLHISGSVFACYSYCPF
jgi:hypothetical protein